MPTTVTDDLPDWSTLASEVEWSTLLVGNGMSMNLWDGFGYDSLRDHAVIAPEPEKIFTELATTNFEAVLEAIHLARMVNDALGDPPDKADAAYTTVRDALFSAVNSSHVPWGRIPAETADLIADTLSDYSAVFTTNYDLCIYWSQMEARERGIGRGIKDFLWSGSGVFDPANVEPYGTRNTLVYYLHGALHLWQDDQGQNGKWTTGSAGRTLLDVLSTYTPDGDTWPLFVSEGTSEDKLRSIRRSSYLSFCLDSLRRNDGNTVVFGHSLSSADRHIVDALKGNGDGKRIAFAIHPSGSPDAIIAKKAEVIGALGSRHKVKFFDSTTFPLGSPDLKIPAITFRKFPAR